MNDNQVSTELDLIVEKMVSAGESEADIAGVIKQYRAQESEPETENVEETSEVPLTGEDPSHCLLYTSPSPRDRTRSRMPSSA